MKDAIKNVIDLVLLDYNEESLIKEAVQYTLDHYDKDDEYKEKLIYLRDKMELHITQLEKNYGQSNS